MDLRNLPPVDQPLERLAAYQRERSLEESSSFASAEERKRVAEVLFKRDLGEELTERD